jgi:hypothetical protein
MLFFRYIILKENYYKGEKMKQEYLLLIIGSFLIGFGLSFLGLKTSEALWWIINIPTTLGLVVLVNKITGEKNNEDFETSRK